ncbi:hypothetical protein QKQ66_gp042 [Dione juno nucleopolyhedrovirus]|uniref:Uncharacterized protein n=1 Tax=Dione juno nucleopolyhedrovirus TaxID=2594175 RepID=A0AAE6LC88_9ABAC|nr:hypothetical protein QKQ66_gp042 [Dione juno nucleopolyhedrovirus]QDL57026.1 hypothetical protein DijuNPV-ORF-42 [Dione juno nucleopolyhedrovirus]
MNVFRRCCQYTRLSNASVAVTQFSLVNMSLINVTLCVYGIIVAAYLSTTTNIFEEIQFLQYWLMLSLLISGHINVPLCFKQNKTEADEVVYELKMLHAMYLANVLVRYGVINTAHSALSASLIVNLVHCCGLVLLLVELIVLLQHTLGTYSDYRYAKACFMLMVFVAAGITIVLMNANRLNFDFVYNNSFVIMVMLSFGYLSTAIVWAVRKEIANSNLQRVQVASAFTDPPPSFAAVEMQDLLKINPNVPCKKCLMQQ